MKILVATEKPFAAAAVNGIKEIAQAGGHETVLLEKYPSADRLLEAVADADALIVRSDKITKEVIDAAGKLKIVVRAGAGYDNICLDACTQRGIVVMNTPGQNSNAVAELAIAMMIYMSRNCFTPGTGSEIQGKKVGIQAYGNVGRLVAAKAKALGMDVMAFDPFVDNSAMEQEGVIPAASVEEMYSACDFISLHIPATPLTKESIGYDLVTRMPKGGCLVNTARKEVINEAYVHDGPVLLGCRAGEQRVAVYLAVEQLRLFDIEPVDGLDAAYPFEPLQCLGHHEDREYRRRVVHGPSVDMHLVVKHCRDISAHFAQGVLADDGERYPCRAHILLRSSIDEGVFAHVHRAAHDVG